MTLKLQKETPKTRVILIFFKKATNEYSTMLNEMGYMKMWNTQTLSSCNLQSRGRY